MGLLRPCKYPTGGCSTRRRRIFLPSQAQAPDQGGQCTPPVAPSDTKGASQWGASPVPCLRILRICPSNKALRTAEGTATAPIGLTTRFLSRKFKVPSQGTTAGEAPGPDRDTPLLGLLGGITKAKGHPPGPHIPMPRAHRISRACTSRRRSSNARALVPVPVMTLHTPPATSTALATVALEVAALINAPPQVHSMSLAGCPSRCRLPSTLLEDGLTCATPHGSRH